MLPETLSLQTVKEVQAFSGSYGRDRVNEELGTGDWVLLKVRVVETKSPKGYETVYVIGRVN